MKKKIIISLLVIISLFIITGCEKTNNKSKDNEKSNEKVTFTVESKHDHVTFKVPEGADTGYFKDLGHSCFISYYTNQSSVAALYPHDDKVDKIDKVTINDFTYDTYKYVEGTTSSYVYRTKINNDYHLFIYECINSEYDDSQVEKFMDTVEYTYDSIDYKYE